MCLFVCLFVSLGGKARSEFDAILKQVLQSDWSVDPPSRDTFYVTWGTPHGGGGGGGGGGVGEECRSLGCLSSTDLAGLVDKAVIAYGE